MTHNRFSNFHCVYTIIEVVHSQFKKVVVIEYSAFKSSSKVIQRKCCRSSYYCTNFREKQSKKKEKGRVSVKPWLKRRKNLEYYETLLPELQLEDEYNYNILLQMTSENVGEIFQLIKDN